MAKKWSKLDYIKSALKGFKANKTRWQRVAELIYNWDRFSRSYPEQIEGPLDPEEAKKERQAKQAALIGISPMEFRRWRVLGEAMTLYPHLKNIKEIDFARRWLKVKAYEDLMEFRDETELEAEEDYGGFWQDKDYLGGSRKPDYTLIRFKGRTLKIKK